MLSTSTTPSSVFFFFLIWESKPRSKPLGMFRDQTWLSNQTSSIGSSSILRYFQKLWAIWYNFSDSMGLKHKIQTIKSLAKHGYGLNSKTWYLVDLENLISHGSQETCKQILTIDVPCPVQFGFSLFYFIFGTVNHSPNCWNCS